MYFKDLEKIQQPYAGNRVEVKIGWLDDGIPYNKGDVSNIFLDKLKSINPRIRTKGWHTCPFCGNARSSTQFIIPIEGEKNTFYDAPYMIIHYIEEHDYKPPQEFINSVLNL